ncbi:MAG TPA: 4-hydroxy-tetrahydrodipicolinate reductase [Bacteroidota bacterium]|nr:4-hydroxy-tetrahydrodipicolinate reductase [Bacteroidota bacterium]
MNIALIGYGNMGKEVEQAARSRGFTIAKTFTLENNLRGIGITPGILDEVDVCIDFSVPSAVVNNIATVAACGKNIVVGTTGWYDKMEEVKQLVTKYKIGLVYSPNFSLGMNIFYHIVKSAASAFDPFDVYDVAVQEIHHRKKSDSPSGTALALSQIILRQIRRKKEVLHETAHGEIKPEQLQVTSTRVGNVVGTHSVVFDSEADSIELKHVAKNRRGFAFGALIAAEWIKGKHGLYTMNDVLSNH